MKIENYMLGTDFSHHNDIDLTGCGIQSFIFLKATEGLNFEDYKMNQYLEDIASTRNAQTMPFIGFYHFAHPERNTPHDEAVHYLSEIKNHIGYCMTVLDIEGIALRVPDIESWCLRWLEEVEDVTGSRPIFYIQASDVKKFPYIALAYPLWVACYSPDSRKGKYKDVIEKATFIQITDHPFDIDVFKGSPADMTQLIKR